MHFVNKETRRSDTCSTHPWRSGRSRPISRSVSSGARSNPAGCIFRISHSKFHRFIITQHIEIRQQNGPVALSWLERGAYSYNQRLRA